MFMTGEVNADSTGGQRPFGGRAAADRESSSGVNTVKLNVTGQTHTHTNVYEGRHSHCVATSHAALDKSADRRQTNGTL